MQAVHNYVVTLPGGGEVLQCEMFGSGQYAFITKGCRQIYTTDGSLDDYLFPDDVLQFQVLEGRYIAVRTLHALYAVDLEAGRQLLLFQQKHTNSPAVLVASDARVFQGSVWAVVVQYSQLTQLAAVRYTPADRSCRTYKFRMQQLQRIQTHVQLAPVVRDGQEHFYVIVKDEKASCTCMRFAVLQDRSGQGVFNQKFATRLSGMQAGARTTLLLRTGDHVLVGGGRMLYVYRFGELCAQDQVVRAARAVRLEGGDADALHVCACGDLVALGAGHSVFVVGRDELLEGAGTVALEAICAGRFRYRHRVVGLQSSGRALHVAHQNRPEGPEPGPAA